MAPGFRWADNRQLRDAACDFADLYPEEAALADEVYQDLQSRVMYSGRVYAAPAPAFSPGA